MSKIPFTTMFLLFVANIGLNSQNYAAVSADPPCFDDWKFTPVWDTCSSYVIQLEGLPASEVGLDTCENYCLLVTIDPNNSGFTDFLLTSSNGYNAELSANTSLQAVICVGQDSGIPIDLDPRRDVKLDVNVEPLDLRSGGCICSVMIGG